MPQPLSLTPCETAIRCLSVIVRHPLTRNLSGWTTCSMLLPIGPLHGHHPLAYSAYFSLMSNYPRSFRITTCELRTSVWPGMHGTQLWRQFQCVTFGLPRPRNACSLAADIERDYVTVSIVNIEVGTVQVVAVMWVVGVFVVVFVARRGGVWNY